jgi:hypothetical protein
MNPRKLFAELKQRSAFPKTLRGKAEIISPRIARIGERTRPRVLVSAPSPKRTSFLTSNRHPPSPATAWQANGHQFPEKEATTDCTDNADRNVIWKKW